MKNLFKLTLTILILAVFFTSCSSNDEDLNQNNITLNGKSFPIIRGTIVGVSIDDSGHSGISLVSGTTTEVKTLTIDIPNFTKETISGTYSFPEVTGDYVLNDFLTSYVFIDNMQQITTANLKAGKAIVSHNEGNNYSITIDLLMVDGMIFKGTYSGDFTILFNNQ